jgi:uncharacterized sporulation protein YeaH/YhbH (DUF444 family)
VAIHIVDRRLNPGSKSLENRQRFLRRAKALVQGAVKKSSQDRDIKDVLEGGEVSVPIDGMDEPRFRREGGTRDMVLPGNKKFVEGDILPRPNPSGGKGRVRARATAKIRSASFSAATSLSTCSWTIWNCPISPSESSPRSKARAFAGRATQPPARPRIFR